MGKVASHHQLMKYCPECKTEYTDDQAICPKDAQTLISRHQQPEKSDPLIGLTIAEKYRIDHLIGKGGMGAVYEGMHLMLDRPVAIKVLHKNMNMDEKAAARFIREAKAAAKIEHPNAVTIHDFGVLADGSAYLVMEFIKGDSLRHYLMVHGKVDLERAVDWISQVCAVLEVAHKHGIIHRDLKPENVMLKQSPDGSVTIKVVDFGLAKLTSSMEGGGHLTQTGEVMGTPHYMAPEYYEGENIDNRADIYAIGIIFYEMLTGITPFSGTMQSIIGGHLFKDPRPLFEAVPGVDYRINDVVLKALKKKRDERTASAAEFAQSLKQACQAVVAGQSVSPSPAPPPPPQSTVEVQNVSLPQASQSLQQEGYKTVAIAGGTPYDPNARPEKVTVYQGGRQTEVQDSYSPSTHYLAQNAGGSGEVVFEEPESVLEILKSMRLELAIGSIVVTILAICMVAFIIYKSQQSSINVKPIEGNTEQKSTP